MKWNFVRKAYSLILLLVGSTILCHFYHIATGIYIFVKIYYFEYHITYHCFLCFLVMYPTYAKWVQSHRDLPIKLNQWCNIVVSMEKDILL